MEDNNIKHHYKIVSQERKAVNNTTANKLTQEKTMTNKMELKDTRNGEIVTQQESHMVIEDTTYIDKLLEILISYQNQQLELLQSIKNMEDEKIKKEIDIQKFRDYYDTSETIEIATADDPDDFSSAAYQRAPIHQILERNADILYVSNDGTSSLFTVVSHYGAASFSKEEEIFPGEVKKFYNIYEMRFRSPALIEYRVTEYNIAKSTSSPNRDEFTAQSSRNINAAPLFTQLPDITIPEGFALVIRAEVHNTNDVYVANSGANTNDANNRNILDNGDNIRLFVTNANLIFVAGSAANQSVDILVEQ